MDGGRREEGLKEAVYEKKKEKERNSRKNACGRQVFRTRVETTVSSSRSRTRFSRRTLLGFFFYDREKTRMHHVQCKLHKDTRVDYKIATSTC